MTIDELTTLMDQLERFQNQYCHDDGLENYQVHFGQSRHIVQTVRERKVREMRRSQLCLDEHTRLWAGDIRTTPNVEEPK